MTRLQHAARRLARDSRGATAIEYGLIAALIAVALVVTFRAFGTSVADLWSRVGTGFSAVA